MAQKRQKELKLALNPDQFSINEKGELVINEADIMRTVQEAQQAASPGQTAAAEIEVVVTIGVGF